MGGAADGGGEPAGIIAGRDRPRVPRGIDFGDDANVLRRQPECLGESETTPCDDPGLVVRTRHGLTAERIQRYRRRRCAPFFGPALAGARPASAPS